MDKKSKFQKFVEGSVRKQTEEILLGKRNMYSLKKIMYSSKKLFMKYDELKFERSCYYYYSKKKNYYVSKLHRVKKNKIVNKLNDEYKEIDVIKLAKLLVFYEKISLQSKNDLELLEMIIKATLSIPLFDKTAILRTEGYDKVDKDFDMDEYLELKENNKKIMETIKKNKAKYN